MTVLRRLFPAVSGARAVRPVVSRTSNASVVRAVEFARAGPLRWYGVAHLSEEQAEERVLGVLKKNDKVDVQKLNLATPFTQLGLDSLDVVEVMIALEDEFHLEIPDAVADKVQTPKEIAQYIYEFLSPHRSPGSAKADNYSEEAEH